MSQPGIGAMIGYLGGNEETVAAYHKAINKPIRAIRKDDEGDGSIVVSFDDGTLTIADQGRSCCEHRYLTCDDDLASLVGAPLLSIEQRPGPEEQDSYDGAHETSFVEIATSNGSATITTHNVHNGYYGGFWLTLAWEAA